jgi:predicted AAA+ superfamily ATPase
MYSIIVCIAVIAIIFNPIFTLLRQNRINKLANLRHSKLQSSNEELDEVNLSQGIYFANEINSNNKVIISDEELNQHALVIGTTGSGKTTTLMNIVDSCCSKGLPLIYIDGKGSVKLANQIKQICDKYQRRLKVFSLDPNQLIPNIAAYNPFAFGNFTEWKNKIITLTQEADNKGQEHYSLQEQSYISLLCEILHKSNVYVDLEAIIAYIKDRDELQKLANRLSPEIGSRLIKMGRDTDESDLIKVLETFYYSHYGDLFVTTNKDSDEIINLVESIENGEVVLFLLDAASYKRDTNLLGKLIINDINAAFSSFGRSSKRYNGYCIFDEFASYATSNMASILSMQRDNGLHAIVGTQSIHAISVENSHVKRVAVELIANCNTFIIHKINDPHDIELLINTIGTKMHIEVSHSHGSAENQTRYTTRMVEKYLIRAQDIRSLQAGFGYICRTVILQKPVKVKFLKLN